MYTVKKQVYAFWAMLFVLLSSTLALSAGRLETTPREVGKGWVKVLLEEKAPAAFVEVKGLYRVEDPLSGRRLTTGIFGKGFLVQPTSSGVRWGEVYPRVFQIRIIPHEKSSLLVNGVQYKGNVVVYQVGEQLHVVNEVAIEDYTRSILGAECSTTTHKPEVMNALAIAVRTDATFMAEHNSNAFWHLKARDIGYQGYAVTEGKPAVDAAVKQTAGLVMVYGRDAHSFPVRWTEHCGGKTVDFQTIFRRDFQAPREGVEAPFALADRQQSNWTWKINATDLATILGVEKVVGIERYVDKNSGKVYGIFASDGKGGKQVDFLTLRQMVGADHLQSSDFTVSLDKGVITFSGYGKGTGVGLCLYSAEKMAERGDDAKNILAAFFPSAKVTALDVR